MNVNSILEQFNTKDDYTFILLILAYYYCVSKHSSVNVSNCLSLKTKTAEAGKI